GTPPPLRNEPEQQRGRASEREKARNQHNRREPENQVQRHSYPDEVREAVARGGMHHGIGLVAHGGGEGGGGGKRDRHQEGLGVHSQRLGGGNADRDDQDRRGVVAHHLGERGGQQVHHGQAGDRPHAADQSDRIAGQPGGAAGVFQCDPQ